MKKLILAGALLLAVSNLGFGQSVYWQNTSVVNQVNYNAFGFKIDMTALKAQMQLAGQTPQTGVNVMIPSPEGKVLNFNVWRNSLIPSELQSKFPDVWSFTAISKDRKGVSAKMELTPRGFSVMVYDGASTFLIDTVNSADNLYKSFYKSDYPNSQNWTCGFENESPSLTGGEQDYLKVAAFTMGQTKRTYRLALSCTGEYAVAVGGTTPTVTSVFAAMTTTMNRVNGIYERELGVTMEFIANNNLLVYVDPTTDPFSANNNGSALLSQNQANTTTVIGAADYDIGHIFSTGGGGIAALASVCKNNKAMGVTGSPNPVGDPFDVDYVSHEMGHQFGGNHTFNKCSGTENSSTAFEPGSGSTIMAYAGICAPINNIQPNSNDYFHKVSLYEINQRFLATNSVGSCAVTATGYNAPTFNVTTANYNIPNRTPFELDFPSATPLTANNSITMNVEQWNLGNYQLDDSASANFTLGPSFRSWSPDTIYYRSFPRNSILRSGLFGTRGERLSNVARNYKFAYSARELQADGYGTVNLPDELTNINVDDEGPFLITYPSDMDSIIKNSSTPVLWDVANTTAAPVSCATVDIYLSLDGGITFPTVLATNVPNTGTANVNIPDVESTTARIKIKGSNNIFFTFSKRNVVIGTTASPIDTGSTSVRNVSIDNLLSVFPNPAFESINVVAKQNLDLAKLQLINTIGQVVWNGEISKAQSQVQIKVGNFAKGIYLLKFIDDKGKSYSKQIVIQ